MWVSIFRLEKCELETANQCSDKCAPAVPRYIDTRQIATEHCDTLELAPNVAVQRRRAAV
jgi:hypothetical protein